MERRRYPRQPLSPQDGIRATLVLSGTSLIHKRDPSSQIEINGNAVDISRGGVCIEISFEAPWQSILHHDEIDLLLEKENLQCPLKGRVMHSRMKNKVVGVAFEAPIGDVAPWLLPPELQKE